MPSAKCCPFRIDLNVLKDMSPLSQKYDRKLSMKWAIKETKAYLSVAMTSDKITDTLYVAISNIRYSRQNTMLFEKVYFRLPV